MCPLLSAFVLRDHTLTATAVLALPQEELRRSCDRLNASQLSPAVIAQCVTSIQQMQEEVVNLKLFSRSHCAGLLTAAVLLRAH